MIKMYCKRLKHGQNQLDLTGIRNVFMRQLISLLQNETINIKNNIVPPLLNLTKASLTKTYKQVCTISHLLK